MPDDATQPDDELAQAIKRAILAGAAEGAESTARRIAAAASTGLDEVTAVLKALAAGTLPPPVTVTAYAGLASARAVAGIAQVTEKSGGAIAGLHGAGTLGITRADVAAAADELRVIGQPDVENLAGQPPVKWSKQELVVNSLFLLAVVYWLLPSSARPVLTDIASLVQGVDAVVSLLRS